MGGVIKYWAFLSYSHRDARWGTRLHKALESYRPPKQLVGKITERGPIPARLSPIFRDREELASATDLGTSINDALSRSISQIVICSPSAARSRWVNEEILAFKRLGREDRIFCIIVDGEPNASDYPTQAHLECFPPALRYRIGADGELSSIRTEPIAADARAGKDGRNAKLKLIAGILGVGYDALKQRELRRAQRKLFAIASGAVAGMVITSGLAVAALIARATAQRETVIAKQEAETARQTTSFLVDLFRISDPSEARGNSLTAREVLDRGAARIEAQLRQQPQIQATLMDTLGTVYMGLGLYKPAQPLLQAAMTIRQSLPLDERSDLALSLSHLGDLRTARAEYPGAESAYEGALAVQRSLPPSERDEATLAKTLFGLGSEQIERGDNAAAERTLRSALAIQQRLTPGPNADTARTLQLLGRAVEERNSDEAIALLEKAVAMHRALWGTQPYPDFAASLNDLGLMLYYDNSDYDHAEQLLLESMAMKRKLLGDKHPEIATSLSNIADVLHNKGDLAGAEKDYLQSLAMYRELLGDDHPYVARTLNNLAFVYYDKGDIRGALQTERESLAIYRKDFPGDNPEVARVENRLGYWLTETRQYDDAERCLNDALAMRIRLFGKSHPDVASSLVHVAILDVAIHKYPDAILAAHTAGEIFTKTFSATSWETALANSVEGAARGDTGDYAAAEAQLLHGYTILQNDGGAVPMYRTLVRGYVRTLYERWGRRQEAERYAAVR